MKKFLILLLLVPVGLIAATNTYLTKSGDTLQKVAANNGITVSQLAEANPNAVLSNRQNLVIPISPAPASSPTSALAPAPAPSSVLNGLVQVAGWRSSDYGIEDSTAVRQGDAAYYTAVAKTMAAMFSGSKPGGLYTVGYIETNTTMLPNELGLAVAGITGIHIDALGNQASPEAMLTAFDQAGLNVILSIEPGKANVVQLAVAILNKYKNHPSVKGFGVDNEWYMSEGGKMSVNTASLLRNAIIGINPTYKTVLKHFDSSKLPKGITGIVYLTDSCGFNSKAAAEADYVAWAKSFSGSEIGYQFGYDEKECGTPDDTNWWQPMGSGGQPALSLIQDIKAKVPSANIYSVYWVDFTILTQFPK